MSEVSTKEGPPPKNRATEMLPGSRGGGRNDNGKPLDALRLARRKEKRLSDICPAGSGTRARDG